MISITRSLADQDFAVIPGFLTPQQCASARVEIARLDQTGRFAPAGVGQGGERRLEQGIRGDRISWFEPAHLEPTQKEISEKLESLRLALNEELFLSLIEMEGHYAIYPEGAFYRAHLDRFRKDDSRTVSVVLYLHEKWRREDGGELVMHLDPGPLEILPEEGTLVC
ncbi:MAG: 2OG-Fe(II) oxygenase, partial [Bdellovibrionota bacterium]